MLVPNMLEQRVRRLLPDEFVQRNWGELRISRDSLPLLRVEPSSAIWDVVSRVGRSSSTGSSSGPSVSRRDMASAAWC